MDWWDVIAAVGIVLIGVGLSLFAPWLGVTAAGVLLVAGGIVGGTLAERAPAKASKGGGS
ncbi:hypothetical protein OG216_25930 [Streptomycetaceae bacterium NBC_01309]